MISPTMAELLKLTMALAARYIIVKNMAIIHWEPEIFRKKELALIYGKKRIQEIENHQFLM